MKSDSSVKSPDSRRTLSRVVRGIATSDGAGVELTRVIAQPALPMLDPFLLLDVFRSDRPEDYLPGFPPHPHRGFETVTYMLEGRVRHRDNAGHEGVIEPGGVQWMTAGRGIVHSEMPEQAQGMLEGVQLWVNLPAAHKMDDPAYQEHPARDIPLETRGGGASVRVISGETSLGTRGAVQQPLTEPLYLDVELKADTAFEEVLPTGHNAFLFVMRGGLTLEAAESASATLGPDDLGVLSHGSSLQVQSGSEGVRFLLVAGKPLNEPVARGGPFVMNTASEIRQAREDYQSGRF